MARTRNTTPSDPFDDPYIHTQGSTGKQDASDRRFAYFWGRRRLAHLVTLMPQDQREMDRLDFQHHLLRKALGRNHLAPISAPDSILDVGCGTGRWSIEMAEEYPAAAVVGIDLLPPDPYGRTPSNCFFQYGNVLDTLPMPDGTFTLVHQRFFLDAIPYAIWPRVARELLRVTRPGGFIEVVEFGLPLSAGPALATFCQWLLAIGNRHGFDLRAADRLGEVFVAGETTSVAVRQVEIPLGRHGGRIGTLAHTNFRALLLAMREPLIQEQVTSQQGFDLTLARVDHEIEMGHTTLPLYVYVVCRLA